MIMEILYITPWGDIRTANPSPTWRGGLEESVTDDLFVWTPARVIDGLAPQDRLREYWTAYNAVAIPVIGMDDELLYAEQHLIILAGMIDDTQVGDADIKYLISMRQKLGINTLWDIDFTLSRHGEVAAAKLLADGGTSRPIQSAALTMAATDYF